MYIGCYSKHPDCLSHMHKRVWAVYIGCCSKHPDCLSQMHKSVWTVYIGCCSKHPDCLSHMHKSVWTVYIGCCSKHPGCLSHMHKSVWTRGYIASFPGHTGPGNEARDNTRCILHTYNGRPVWEPLEPHPYDIIAL